MGVILFLFIFIFFQTVPVGTGWGKSVQACSNTAPSSISHSGSVPGDCWNTWASTWLLKMPLELLSQEERCSAGGRKTLDRQALKKTRQNSQPFLFPLQCSWSTETQDEVSRYCEFISSSSQASAEPPLNLYLQKTFKRKLLPYKNGWEQGFLLLLFRVFPPHLFVQWRGLYYLLNGITAFPLKSLF